MTRRALGATLLAILAFSTAIALPRPGQTAPSQPVPSQPPPTPRGTAAHGREIYESARCGLCHATTFAQEERDGLLRAGHPLEGGAARGTWWQGRVVTDAGDASEVCLKSYVDQSRDGFAPDERKALILFMQSLGNDRGVGPLQILKRDAGDVDLSAGDPARGRAVYQSACLSCHPGAPAEIRTLAGSLSPAQIADVVRRGTKTMPFFQVDRLPAARVADVAAYLEATRSHTPR